MAAPRVTSRARDAGGTAAAYGLLGLSAILAVGRHAQIGRVPTELRTWRLRRPLPMWHSALAPVLRRLTDVAGELVPGVTVREDHVDRPHGPAVRVLVYAPESRDEPSGVLVWMHGGGLVLGTADVAHERCSAMARDLNAVVVSVDYRLAPEAPYPAAIDDCAAVLAWVHGEAARLGVDRARVAVGGDSAGGGLAACLAQRARDEGLPVAFQALFYPMLDDRTGSRGRPPGLRGPLTWSPVANRAGWSAYLGHRGGLPENRPYAVAARREDLSGLAPAWVGVGEFDLFHDEDVEYARRLRAAGVPCDLVTVPGMYHGADASVRPAPPSMVMFMASATEALRRAIGTTASA